MLRSPRRLFSSLNGPITSASRPRRFVRRLGYVALGTGAVWVADTQFNASAITRNVRTLWTCAIITLDYKLNFTEEKSDQIPELHERVANRLYDLLTTNGGLYIKIGQAIGANAAVLPKAIQLKFAKLFDDAPQVPYSTISSVFQSEFGRPPDGPDGVFEIFEEQAVASASIAQVHKAKLWNEDTWVAVKVQKPDVKKQVEWDLAAYRLVMWFYENVAFDLPVYFVVDFITDHLRLELDFIQEAANAQETAEFVASEKRLSQNVHVPKVYPHLTTKRVMTAEWIDGVRMSDREGVRRLMCESKDPSTSDVVALKGGVNSVMQIMVELFSAQIFDWGWVHCDPHPGNIIIRPNPANPSRPQVVLLDHGLYVRLPDQFRRQYADLWRGLLAADLTTVKRVAEQWGIGAPDLFASATLLRPVKFKDGEGAGMGVDIGKLSQYEQSVLMKEKLRGFLVDTDKIPKQLVFLGRNMRIVQGNNQAFGSPVNRIRITGDWASRSLTTMPHSSWSARLRESWHHIVYHTVMLSLDFWFYYAKTTQWTRKKLGLAWEARGFEDELEKAMRGVAMTKYGIEVPADAFDG